MMESLPFQRDFLPEKLKPKCEKIRLKRRYFLDTINKINTKSINPRENKKI
ncbi:hypothetical protein [Methanosarcina siciliae]|uniref:hypothetical protein n=1 Tax=Methanosarcina siciliae TaxID=38027 RepID=UPI000B0D402C|nr:hypothetical protein [Methanosarcina siciliae]